MQSPLPLESGTSSSPSLLHTHVSDEDFVTWLTSELQTVPGRQVYRSVFDEAIHAIVRWRQRYRGNPAVWQRIFKKDRVVKELVEAAPIMDAMRTLVDSYEGEEKLTILDLCSGKGYLSMFLSEMLPATKVGKCILVDKAWPMCNATEPLPHQMNWDHIYGNIINESGTDVDTETGPSATRTYFDTWPIPLHTSKQDLKHCGNKRQMKKFIFDRTHGPIIVLAVHLCGTLSLKAVDMFNNHENIKFFILKPCCLPNMIHAQRKELFCVGKHSFPAVDVCNYGKFANKKWDGPPRFHLEAKFNLWSDHLYEGIDDSNNKRGDAPEGNSKEEYNKSCRKEKHVITIQVDGGFQNRYIFAERLPCTRRLWEELAEKADQGSNAVV